MENTDKTQSSGAGTPKTENKPNNQPNTGSAAPKGAGDDQKTQGGGQAADAGSQISDQVGNIVRGDTGAVKDVLNQAKESTGAVASQAYGFATQKATSVIDEQKTNLKESLSSVAGTIRQVGETLRGGDQPTGIANTAAQYTDQVADKVEQITGYLDRRDLNGLLRDVKGLAQTNPALFLGGAFTLGILAARFIKSGNPNQSLMLRAQNVIGGGNAGGGNVNRIKSASQNTQVKPLVRKDTKTGAAQTGGSTASNTASQNKGG